MWVLVCGGRDYTDSGRLDRVLRDLHTSVDGPITTLIHGAAQGADSLAGAWAEAAGIDVIAFPADWETHKRAAGPIRNAAMLRDGKPDLVVAFPGGRGTANMVKQAKAAGVVVRIVAEQRTE